MSNSLVIIGSGLAGYNLAREWRKHDKDSKLTIVTEEAGVYYSKPLLSSALGHDKALEKLQLHDREGMSTSLNAEIKAHQQVTAINTAAQTVTLSSGEKVPYSKLVLAVGALPTTPTLSGNANEEFIQINHLEDYHQFRKKLQPGMTVTLLGAGLIGSELANDLSKSGYHVHLVCSGEAPLPRLLPAQLGKAMIEALNAQGATVHCHQKATAIDKHEQGYIVTTNTGETIESDLVISCIGLTPNTALAKDAGLKIEYGIWANEFGQTSDPNIFTIGDCANIDGHCYQFVMPIMQAAKPMALTLAGTPSPIQYPIMPVSAKTACPMTAVPPSSPGVWEVKGDMPDYEAVCRDEVGNIVGFALTGKGLLKRKEYLALLQES